MGIPWGIRPNPSSTSPWTFDTSRSSSSKVRKGCAPPPVIAYFRSPWSALGFALARERPRRGRSSLRSGTGRFRARALPRAGLARRLKESRPVPSEGRQPGDHRGREEVAADEGRDKVSQREDFRIERAALAKFLPGVVHHRPCRAQSRQPVPSRRRSLRHLQSVHHQRQGQAAAETAALPPSAGRCSGSAKSRTGAESQSSDR